MLPAVLVLGLACAEPPIAPADPVPAPTAELVSVPGPPPPEPPPPRDPLADQRPPPEGFVDLRATLDGALFDVRYHTADNFTGAPLPGYGVPGAWLLAEPAEALARVQADLRERGLTLLVYDAYRPLRGTLAMVAWAERTGQAHLLDDGYIARRSGHNKGNTIDLTVADVATGLPLDMGTPWDTLTEASHTRNAEGAPLANRLLLKETMQAHGFEAYWKEWWHFGFPMEGKLPHRDVPYACFEPDEGAFVAPDGWGAPGYVMPAGFTPGPCGANPPP